MRRVALAIFATIAGLVGLLSFKTQSPSVAALPAAVSTAPPSVESVPGSATSPAAPSTAGSPSTAAKTVTGDSIDTRWGPVQVKITVTGGKITSATAVDYPENNGRDEEINAYAIPTLEKESIGQSTAKIDMVSGATYTSDGYIQSMQSALDKL